MILKAKPQVYFLVFLRLSKKGINTNTPLDGVFCTYIVQLSLVILFDSVASQANNITRPQTVIPADTHTVP